MVRILYSKTDETKLSGIIWTSDEKYMNTNFDLSKFRSEIETKRFLTKKEVIEFVNSCLIETIPQKEELQISYDGINFSEYVKPIEEPKEEIIEK